MSNISLHPLWLTAMPAYQHVIGVVTHALSALALYLMITKTPETGRAFARYLIFMQVSISLVDLNFGFLFCPILLYPAPGFLCNGVLCIVFGDTGHSGVVLLTFAVLCSVLSFGYAFFFKFLTLLEMAKRKQFSQFNIVIFRAVMFTAYQIITIFVFGLYRNLEGGTENIRTNFPSLFYLFENQNLRAFAYDMRLHIGYITLFVSVTVVFMIFTVLLAIVLVAGSFYLLYVPNAHISEKTRQLQLSITWLLSFQTLILVALQLLPVTLYVFSLITLTMSPDINNLLFCFQLTHASVHSVVVISTNSSYREPLIFWRRDRSKNSVSSFSTTIQLS